MRSPRLLRVLVLTIIAGLLAPHIASADRGGGKPRPPLRRPGTPFKFSHASYRPTIKVTHINASGRTAVVALSFRVRRGHVENIEVLVDGRVVASSVLEGHAKSGTATITFPSSRIVAGAHSVKAYAHQGRPGHKSIKGISRSLRFSK